MRIFLTVGARSFLRLLLDVLELGMSPERSSLCVTVNSDVCELSIFSIAYIGRLSSGEFLSGLGVVAKMRQQLNA